MNAEALHATFIRVHQKGVLIRGPAGSGKSSLALALLGRRGTALVTDDLTLVEHREGALVGFADTLHQGELAIRGVGILNVALAYGENSVHSGAQCIDWIVDLTNSALTPTPEHDHVMLCGLRLPRLQFAPHSSVAELIDLSCRLGSDALLDWKTTDATS